MRENIDENLKLLVDDGYNNTPNTVRADYFMEPEYQRQQRSMRSIVEIAIGFAKCFEALVKRNKYFPELQEAIILIGYELAQLKMMMNPLRIHMFSDAVLEFLRDCLQTPDIFSLSPKEFNKRICAL